MLSSKIVFLLSRMSPRDRRDSVRHGDRRHRRETTQCRAAPLRPVAWISFSRRRTLRVPHVAARKQEVALKRAPCERVSK
jgi:hypothetical protein